MPSTDDACNGGVYIRACSSLFEQHRAQHPLTLTIPVGFPTTDSHAGSNERMEMKLESQSLELLLMCCWCCRMQRNAPSKSDIPAPTKATKSAVLFAAGRWKIAAKEAFPNGSTRWKLGPKYNVSLHNQPVSTDRTWPTTPPLPFDAEAHPRRTPTGAQSPSYVVAVAFLSNHDMHLSCNTNIDRNILALTSKDDNRRNQRFEGLAPQKQDSQLRLVAPLCWCSQGISQLTVVDTHCSQKGQASSDLSLLELPFQHENLSRFKSEGLQQNQKQRFV
jgi:hypothetical protein